MNAKSQSLSTPSSRARDLRKTEVEGPAPTSLLADIEVRLSAATAPTEATQWAQVRGEILKQNESADWARMQRFLCSFQFFGIFGLSVGSLAAAVALLIANRQDSATLLLLGVASYPLSARVIAPKPSGAIDSPEASAAAGNSRHGGVAACGLLFVAAAALLAGLEVLGLGTRSLGPVAAFACGLFAVATVGQLQGRPQLGSKQIAAPQTCQD